MSVASEVLNQVLATLAACTKPVTHVEVQTLLRLRYGSERTLKEISNRLQYGITTGKVERKHGAYLIKPCAQFTPPQAKLRAPAVEVTPKLGDPAKFKEALAGQRSRVGPDSIAAAAPKVADAAKAVEVVAQLAELGVSSANLAGDAAAAVKACEDVAAAQLDAAPSRDIDQVEAAIERIHVGVDIGPFALGHSADSINAPAGLRDRLRAIYDDIEDAVADACDAELAHRLIKSLVVSGAAVRRALDELPA